MTERFARTSRFPVPSASEEEILRACRIARVDEFAESFADKYDTVVGERGVKLSGGQRQRISIARAILAEPRILILDEATSSLDSESEQMIQQGLSYLMQGRTTFVIAHRLSTIRRADQILVMEQGGSWSAARTSNSTPRRAVTTICTPGSMALKRTCFLRPAKATRLTVTLNGGSGPARNGDVKAADALRVLRGEVR